MSKQRTPEQQRLAEICAKITKSTALRDPAKLPACETVRFESNHGEHERLREAAQALGMTQSAFMRGAVRAAVEHVLAKKSALTAEQLQNYLH